MGSLLKKDLEQEVVKFLGGGRDMGWLEDQEIRTKKAEDKARESNQAYLGRKSSFGGGGHFGGSGMSSIVKGTSDTEKLPKEQFERDFLLAIDGSMLDLQALGTIFSHFTRSAMSSKRFQGVGKDGVLNHLNSVLKEYRPDVNKFLEGQIKDYMGGR
jgi:hypothetical protein